jgi:glycosyltransferase involved in cell wall biosynthesis
MKLAIISPFQLRFARGIERFTWSLATALADQDHTVDLLTWNWPKPVQWGEMPAGMCVRRVPYSRYYMERLAVPYYLTWLLRNRYDWVMLYFASYGEPTMLRLLRQQRVCVVVHFPYEAAPFPYAQLQRCGVVRDAARVVAVSNYVADDVRSHFNRGCAVIGNGVDTTVFQPSQEARAAVRARLGAAPDAPVIITVAALEERKGVQWLIRALPYIVQQFPDLQHWIIGEGDYRVALEHESAQLGVQHVVRFLGRLEGVEAYLAAADVGCLLSRGEAFGIAILEAMATALPIVASNRAPFDELVAPEWGVLVDETDPDAVAAAFGSLFVSPARCRQMGEAGRQQVVRSYTWTHVAAQYAALLERAAVADRTEVVSGQDD